MTVAGASLGLLIGSAIADPKLVSTIVPMATLPFILFAGLFKNREDYAAWIGWLEYISPNKYAFNAFILNEFTPPTLIETRFVNQLSFDLEMWPAIGVLIGLSFGFRLLALFFLAVLRRRLE